MRTPIGLFHRFTLSHKELRRFSGFAPVDWDQANRAFSRCLHPEAEEPKLGRYAPPDPTPPKRWRRRAGVRPPRRWRGWEDVKIVRLGPNVGLVTYRLAIEGSLRGKPYPAYQRCLQIPGAAHLFSNSSASMLPCSV